MRKWIVLVVVGLGALPLFALSRRHDGIRARCALADRTERRRTRTEGIRAIPIQVNLRDANLRCESFRIPAGTVQPRLGHFRWLAVKEQNRSWVFRLGDFEEIEMSGPCRSPTAVAPTHCVCRPNDDNGDRCESMRLVASTAEWHATAWYVPLTRGGGSDIPLTLTATVTKDPSKACTAAQPADLITLENHVTFHLGEDTAAAIR